MRRRLLVAIAVLAFLAVSAVLARWLAADNVERALIFDLLSAQARGDARAMAGELERCDGECRRRLGRLAARHSGPGEVEIVRLDSSTSHALGPDRGPTRVAWRRGDGLPTVQCIDVRRTGGVLSGPSVTLVGIGPEIGLEASC